MKLSVLFAALLASSAVASSSISAPEIKLLWNTWKSLNNKVYAEAEETKRFTAFVENYVEVTEFNKQNNGAKLALNKFADLTQEEFRAQYAHGEQIATNAQAQAHIDYSLLALPESVDWREKGAVTPVKNQGHCGSCWAFATVGSLEGLNFIKTGKLLAFSEQQLVDCSTENSGCSGGLAAKSFSYTAEKGIETEEDYPYNAADGKCKYDAKKAHHVNTGYKVVTPKDPEALKAAIAVQPLYVSVQADQAAFRFYKSGVVKTGCGAALNHGTVGVGYTKEDGVEAIIIKNSWAATWGDKGYLKISLDKSENNGYGVCGILTRPTYPTV